MIRIFKGFRGTNGGVDIGGYASWEPFWFGTEMFVFLNQVRTWFPENVLRKAYVCIYVCIFVCFCAPM